jgi:hypothetical protein
MKHLSVSFRLLAIAAVFIVSSCKKDSSNAGTAAKDNTVVVSSRTAQPGQSVTVRLNQVQFAQLQQRGSIQIQKEAIENASARGTTAGPNTGVIGGGTGINPGGCPPISQATLNYWQQQANSCCCDFTVCLQDQTCAYVIMLFRPSANSGCGNPGGGGWQFM